jgi:hypothetical protein
VAPNICSIYDVEEAEGRTLIVMELAAGKRLDQIVGRKGLPLDDVLKYAVEIADALAKAHSAGIVHRDEAMRRVVPGPERTGVYENALRSLIAEVNERLFRLVEESSVAFEHGRDYDLNPAITTEYCEQARRRLVSI